MLDFVVLEDVGLIFDEVVEYGVAGFAVAPYSSVDVDPRVLVVLLLSSACCELAEIV